MNQECRGLSHSPVFFGARLVDSSVGRSRWRVVMMLRGGYGGAAASSAEVEIDIVIIVVVIRVLLHALVFARLGRLVGSWCSDFGVGFRQLDYRSRSLGARTRFRGVVVVVAASRVSRWSNQIGHFDDIQIGEEIIFEVLGFGHGNGCAYRPEICASDPVRSSDNPRSAPGRCRCRTTIVKGREMPAATKEQKKQRGVVERVGGEGMAGFKGARKLERLWVREELVSA